MTMGAVVFGLFVGQCWIAWKLGALAADVEALRKGGAR